VNAWTAAPLVLLAADLPAGLWAVCRGSTVQRLIGVSLLSTAAGAVFLLLPRAHDRPSTQDLALILGVLAPAGTLVLTRLVGGRSHDESAEPPGPQD
jgi:multisubunit Na+/H+ antiporter MnhF subunit